MKRIVSCLVLLLLIGWPSAAPAPHIQTFPSTMSYQGLLTDNIGDPMPGPVNLIFELFDDPTVGGSKWGPEAHNGVVLNDGVFNLTLGESQTPVPLPNPFPMEPLWLQITVDGQTLPTRVKLAASPYALQSKGLANELPIDVFVTGERVMRFEANSSPNVIGGSGANTATGGVQGATIGGGGDVGTANTVTDDFGTVSGGQTNRAGDNVGTTSDAPYAAVGGGNQNVASGPAATVGGGDRNTARGGAITIAGGFLNTATGEKSTIAGGNKNNTPGNRATVGGGDNNTASGTFPDVPGGLLNEANGVASLAAGRQAKANHDGAFVWADNNGGAPADFASTAVDQFLIRAANGVGIGTASPEAGSQLDINGTARMTGFKLPPSAGVGKVLTSDVNGVGTWQDLNTAMNGWALTGNSITPGTHFLGTIGPNQPLELKANGQRVFLFDANSAPNLIGGSSANSVTAGVEGATISGGGEAASPNSVAGNFGAVGGGCGNVASGLESTIGGGDKNLASAAESAIGGGRENTASGGVSAVAGGIKNTASGGTSAIGGGIENTASGAQAVIGGGFKNEASGLRSTVGGGELNTAANNLATVGGGLRNEALEKGSVVSGGQQNVANGQNAAIGGGLLNQASGAESTVPGGSRNRAAGAGSFAAGTQAKANHDGTFVWADRNGGAPANFASTAVDQFLIRAANGVGIGTNQPGSPLTVNGVIESSSGGIKFPDGTTQTGASPSRTGSASGTVIGGGVDNTASGSNATVGGGARNNASSSATVIGGGVDNTASNQVATVGGGQKNTASDLHTTIAGGFFNTASASRSTIGGGSQNTGAGVVSTVSGGNRNSAGAYAAVVSGGQDNTASGAYATVPGGVSNEATANYSFAAGTQAKANHEGTFVWADQNGGSPTDFASTAVDQFLIRAAGGVGIGTNQPGSPLTVNGLIESTSGGIKFPDGTTQTTAGSGSLWTENSGDLTYNGGNVGVGGVIESTSGGIKFPMAPPRQAHRPAEQAALLQR